MKVKEIYFISLFYFFVIKSSGQSTRDHVQENRGLPLICGHRGGQDKLLPENSFSTIDYTVKNCNSKPVIIEIDVRKGLDGTLFILHDETMERTTDGRGRIDELPDVYLKSLFLKDSKGKLTKEHIPTFDSLLHYSRDKAFILMLDIKADVWREVIERLVQEKLQHRAIVLTFEMDNLKKVYELSKEVRISCLIRTEGDWNAINSLSIPTENLIAYINGNTPQNLISQLKNNFLMIMADVDEGALKNPNPLPRKWYNEFVKKRRLDIVITDFPVEVSEKLR